MGNPIVTSDNIWDVYSELLHRFENLDDAVDFIEECQVYLQAMDIQTSEEEKNVNKPAGKELLGGPDDPAIDGSYYMGGVNNGRRLGWLH